jgi:hypothetical protein
VRNIIDRNNKLDYIKYMRHATNNTEDKMSNETKTIKDLAEYIEEREAELAHGSETILLDGFVRDYDHVGSVLDGDTDIDVTTDATDVYNWYVAAYAEMERLESLGQGELFDPASI